MSLPVLPANGFEERLRAMGRAVVLFTAEWCGFCRRFEPRFAEAAARHASLPFAVADISDDEGDARWERFDVRVIPTVILFERGEPAARVDSALGQGIHPRDWERFLAALAQPKPLG